MPSSYFPIDGCLPCRCGFVPVTLEVMYGRTPYNIECPHCNKHTYRYRSIGGSPSNASSFWNEIAQLQEITAYGNTLIYEVLGVAMLYNEVRPAILAAWDIKIYGASVHILFSNGKVLVDERQFLHSFDY